eukprot:Em0016g358a
MEAPPTLECASAAGGDEMLSTSKFPRSQKSDKVVLFYASSCTIELRTSSRHVSTGDETDDETSSIKDHDGGAGDEEPDNLLFSNWKRGCDYRRSTSDAKLPKHRPLGAQLKTHAKAKDERRKGNVGQNRSSHKENVDAEAMEPTVALLPPISGKDARVGGGNDGPNNPNAQDHPAALRHALHQDKLPTGADELTKLLAAAQFRDLTPEDYEMLLTLDQSVKPKTVSKTTLSSIEAVEANAKGCVGDVCSVCMDPMGGTQKVKTLPCSHTFHAPCIDQWLANCSRNCPLDGLAFDS